MLLQSTPDPRYQPVQSGCFLVPKCTGLMLATESPNCVHEIVIEFSTTIGSSKPNSEKEA